MSEEFDLWVESFTPPFSTSFLQLFTNKPVVGLVHMLSAEDMIRKYKLPFGFVENFGLRFYKHFIVVNRQASKKILKNNPEARIFVIPNGVDMPNQRSVKKSKRRHILFVGRIEINQKGLDLLLQAYKMIANRLSCNLVIAGSGVQKEVRKLKKLITKLSLTKKVHLVGRVEGKKWEELFKGAWLVVIPSRFETFSMVALEALSFGAPVVCFNIDGLKWLPNTVSVKAKKFSFKQMANSILSLTRNSTYRKRLLRNVPKVLAKHTWESVAESYDKTFQTVLSS
jgi:glycosyltransferase involved in cell wall biosynthesis